MTSELEKALKEQDFWKVKRLLKKDSSLTIRISSLLKETAEKYIKQDYKGFSDFFEEQLIKYLQKKLEEK